MLTEKGREWDGDLLGYQNIGDSFTNLIKSLDGSKVISIEAGFGRGKTFFRRAWEKQLRSTGETVIVVDVLQSDHSGDPIVTLLGALVDAVPKTNKEKARRALESAKKIGAIGMRTAAKVVLRSGADEIIDAFSEGATDALGDFTSLEKIVAEFGEGMSKAAGQLIASQLAAEHVRTKELPQQLELLKNALLQDAEGERVVVIVDELDRCHPNYALAFLESMKLVFSHSGFVFCLMVNADYLERLAKHRFGASSEDEKYLDKFVDIRLSLAPRKELFERAIFDLAKELPVSEPFADSAEFSIEHAAMLASKLAVKSGLSMRKVKRILLKVEVTLRCYSDRAFDVSLLIYLAFKQVSENFASPEDLPRAFLTPEKGKDVLHVPERGATEWMKEERDRDWKLNEIIRDTAPELLELPRDRYLLPDEQNYKDWAVVFKFLAPHYIPSHQEALDGVAPLIVD